MTFEYTDHPLNYYATQGYITDPKDYSRLFNSLPSDIPALCEIIQTITIHYEVGELSGKPSLFPPSPQELSLLSRMRLMTPQAIVSTAKMIPMTHTAASTPLIIINRHVLVGFHVTEETCITGTTGVVLVTGQTEIIAAGFNGATLVHGAVTAAIFFIDGTRG